MAQVFDIDLADGLISLGSSVERILGRTGG